MLTTILLLVLCAPFLWWWMFVLRKFRSIDGIPGPKPLPIIGSAMELGNNPKEFLANLLKLKKQYGDVYKVYVANDLRVVITDPNLIEQVMSSTVHITKSNAYDLLKKWLGNGLLLSTGNKWRSRRKMITPAFHFKILDQFVEVFNSCGDILVSRLSKEVGKDSVDVYPILNLYSLDVICETSMGVRVDAQEGKNVDYVDAVRDFLGIFMDRAFSAWKRNEFLFKLSKNYPEYKKTLATLHNFTNNVIIKRRKEKRNQITEQQEDDGIKRRVALLDMLLECEEANNLSNEDIREEIDTFMFEGHDTTTSGLAFAVLSLAQNPEIQQKVYEEIVEITGTDTIQLTMQHLQECKYLEMVLKEVQRLYPSVPSFERRLEQNWSTLGYDLPKDVFLTLFVYAMHHDEKKFPDPEKFDPNRFLPEMQQDRHKYSYVPFSAGPRNCIGQKFAMLEMKATIIKIIKNFRILEVPNYKPELGLAAVLKSYNGVCVRLQSRHEN